jgi:ATP-dependent DNA helicase RecQ
MNHSAVDRVDTENYTACMPSSGPERAHDRAAGSTPSANEVKAALRQYWGYEAFRPRQEEIVRSLLEGHDTCVIMPTGGGKSLCYQLPAALLPQRTAIVISPLIALMQDQVAQLSLMGISAAFLNSTLSGSEQAGIIKEARAGAYRLLYLSPERLARQDTLDWLRAMPISFFVIDEAHCISEWGHEFRPEYRQMNTLRRNFADAPIAAFTASATQRVRHDIIAQLQLRTPDRYIASFHRPNLHYLVKQCKAKEQRALLLQALAKHEGSTVIIYASTIKRVEETVALLKREGISALAYHGQMDSALRRENQEKWTSDEVPVLVGTNAFGLGINKAAVRAVIHLALPKSIEQYYQEAGRAGRDGLESECLLLWSWQDTILLKHFAEKMEDEEEGKRALDRCREVTNFADRRECRHNAICRHFGETKSWKSCGACDVCLGLPEWMMAAAEGPVAARPTRAMKLALGGEAATAHRLKSVPPKSAPRESVAPAVDLALRDYLREWRREMARQQKTPAFIVMHDTTLDALCLRRPRTLAELRGVSGIGEKKLEMYGREILEALERFRKGARATRAGGPA